MWERDRQASSGDRWTHLISNTNRANNNQQPTMATARRCWLYAYGIYSYVLWDSGHGHTRSRLCRHAEIRFEHFKVKWEKTRHNARLMPRKGKKATKSRMMDLKIWQTAISQLERGAAWIKESPANLRFVCAHLLAQFHSFLHPYKCEMADRLTGDSRIRPGHCGI